MEQIENKIANSGLISIDLTDYYVSGERVEYDLKQNLFKQMILKEKEYRAFIKQHDWTQYKGKHVALHCSVDAIVPSWAYLLLTTALMPFAKTIVYGSLEQLEIIIYEQKIDQLNFLEFQDKRVIVKGCSDVFIPTQAYVKFITKLQPVAKSIMFGEACSTVPLYKRKLN